MWKDSETEIDYLNFGHLTDLLTELIDNRNLLPATIGVYGNWGSGKSSLIKMAINNLNNQNSDEKIVVLNFNGWMFEGYEDAKTVLLESILDTITANAKKTTKVKKLLRGLYQSVDKIKLFKKGIVVATDIVTTGGLGSIISETAKQIEQVTGGEIEETQLETIVSNVKDELNYSDLRDDLRKFQGEFAELLEASKIDKLVVFIDELDRCSPDTIIETLEAMRLFVFTGNTVFIIGADERHISYSVERKFAEIQGKQINIGKEYLEKLVQYPIIIPQLDANEVEFYIFCLLLEDTFEEEVANTIFESINKNRKETHLDFNLKEAISELVIQDRVEALKQKAEAEKLEEVHIIASQLSNLLAVSLNGNPRQCKRFLNTMKMREIMAKSYGIDIKRIILTKIMLLEYFNSPAYEQISILANKSKSGVVQDLADLEKDITNDQNPLSVVLQNEWGMNWLTSTPSLSGIDLRGYLFFSRDTKRNQANVGTLSLSAPGQKVLKLLQGNGISSRKSAIAQKDTLQRFDKIEISRILSENIQASSKIYKSADFQSLFDWVVSNRDVLDETIYFLRSIEGEKIPPASGVLIQNYISQSVTDGKVVSLIEVWREQNDKLDVVFKKTGVN
ncbi:hypothetical protein IGI66_001172 [Enterococcus sp. AZ048]|uniref:KAP family P-loop NTPase fold protein n=1 Tax=Enterococcus sp. AZ048 TaxID=2774658 RepID=UPI003F20E48F